jgi:hypothetical protein
VILWGEARVLGGISVVGETGIGLRELKLASDVDKKLILFFFSIGKITVIMLT